MTCTCVLWKGKRRESEKVANTTESSSPAENERVERPRAGTLAQQRTKEEWARSQGGMPSSFAKLTKTNEQKKVRFVVPPEVPNTDVDESDVDE